MIALAAYLLVAFGYFGVRLLLDGGAVYPGIGVDPQIYTWAFAWWPHAIGSGDNPIVSHAIWAPGGADLAWVTSVPGLALLFSPLTLAAGPLVSYDVAAVLMPALAAWTAYLLCRHVTRAFWPSLAGGYLFGFSGYVLGQFQGHLNLTSVFLLPLVALAVLRFLDGAAGRAATALELGLLLALQVSFSTEVAFTLSLALAVSLVLAFALVRDLRRPLYALLAPLASGYALAGALVSPLLWYLLTDFRPGTINAVGPADLFGADLLNFVVPTRIGLGGGLAEPVSRHFLAGWTEGGAYLGLPAVCILALLAAQGRRRSGIRFLFAAIAVAAIAAFGTYLHVDGRRVVPMPWEHVGYLPLFDDVLPVRLVVYIALAAAVGTAIWAASRAPLAARIALPALAVAFLVPDLALGSWATAVHVPRFFASGGYRHCLHPGENVLALPFGENGNSLLWQADSGFFFRMAGGHLGGLPPASFRRPPAVAAVAVYEKPAPLRAYVRDKRVGAIVVDARDPGGWLPYLAPFGPPQRLGGVLLYSLSGERCTV